MTAKEKSLFPDNTDDLLKAQLIESKLISKEQLDKTIESYNKTSLNVGKLLKSVCYCIDYINNKFLVFDPVTKKAIKEFNLPVTDWLTERVISLPMHTELDEEQQAFIVANVLEFVNKK